VTLQAILAFALGAVALAYLVRRVLRTRTAGTCCGERTCPAARRMLDRLGRTGR
jgi:hypothetical protein